ncbi:phosphoglucosamine mutase [Litorimonas taeanensis]|uniref:Phosphoglucosamine mutase n=1 Tax=Litorimonas taeanensis TaxID=568099 RepID=A0A420WIG9_9PROT|nr:phosphoglucosamine mutase [Litorimonas taeanensis]RKQ70824.1 phosphoglucosamine mutase [Litorimonas taeanensis]
MSENKSSKEETNTPRKFFGTDGIRGLSNVDKMTPESVMRLGQAAGRYFRNKEKGDHHRPTVFIGKDTRLSGYMIEPALVAGFTSVGMDVTLSGPIPTSAVSILTRTLRADMGVMITASHNKYHDNGIKFFGPSGRKLSDKAEIAIEALLDNEQIRLAKPENLGRVKRYEDMQARYIEIAKATFPRRMRLSGLKIVLDCANGAAYHTAPDTMWELGADEVIPLGVSPNGKNINSGCGSTHTDLLSETVVKTGADIGIALDGDADRLIMCDEKGKVIDGDQLLGLICYSWYVNKTLAKPGLVATVMSNLGLERFIQGHKMDFIRTAVGDRHVAARMRQDGYNLGGEQSGHILMPDFAPTGDGTISALQVLAELIRQDKPASEVLNVFDPVPQMLKNVTYSGTSPLMQKEVKKAIDEAQASFGDTGRVLVRASGTEPLIRVMAEGDDEGKVDKITDHLVAVINNYAS